MYLGPDVNCYFPGCKEPVKFVAHTKEQPLGMFSNVCKKHAAVHILAGDNVQEHPMARFMKLGDIED